MGLFLLACQLPCSFVLQSQPRIHLPDAKAKALMERIQNAGTEVVEAKVNSSACIW